ncbi:pyroglutamyl-peptidase 1-like protein [Monodelphis domestica]|uniref:pyroglutamyl-peptidase 1-like protein n=1 Tax=Monodelphis domestica TaxID=13616 RepID=UPI00020F5D7B|nr:pyroglutamyl-peptidase 1-like protein [Monodelphis domestica]
MGRGVTKLRHQNGSQQHSTTLNFKRRILNPVCVMVVAEAAAAAELSNLGLGKDVMVQILQLPVTYKKAKEQVSKIWETLQPQFTVHVGLASSSKAIILEQCGRNQGYRDADICGLLPEGSVCLRDGPDMIESTINMKAVCKNISVNGIQVLFSRDAGRYVCDYTYYLSLHYGNGCAAFIHVPPLSNLLTANLLGRALQIIIEEMLKQFGKARK